jgi:hypothetical protein
MDIALDVAGYLVNTTHHDLVKPFCRERGEVRSKEKDALLGLEA